MPQPAGPVLPALRRVLALGFATLDRTFDADETPGAYVLGQLDVYRGDRLAEAELLERSIGLMTHAAARLVTFGGLTCALPVLRYRALAHGLPAPGLALLAIDDRFAEHVDLAEALAGGGPRASLATVSAACGLTPASAIDASTIAGLFDAGRHDAIAGYLQQRAIAIASLYLRYALLCGALAPEDFGESVAGIDRGVAAAVARKPYLLPFFATAASASRWAARAAPTTSFGGSADLRTGSNRAPIASVPTP